MAKDSKKKGKAGHAAGDHARRQNGQGPRLDAKLAKVVAKRVKKLRVQLAAATRREGKRIRALDKAHRRRQLIEAAIDELSMDVPGKAPVRARVAPPASAAPTAPASESAPTAAPRPPRQRKSAPPKP